MVQDLIPETCKDQAEYLVLQHIKKMVHLNTTSLP